MKPTILVTGDIVLDCHLYGGMNTAAASFNQPGTVYSEHLGGSALTHELLFASSDANGIKWDTEKEKWKENNEGRKKAKKKLLPRPEILDKTRPSPKYETEFGIDTSFCTNLSNHLRSYGVWTDKTHKKDPKERVWRVEHDFGYGSSKDTGYKVFSEQKPQTLPNPPILTLIDDGGILFRHSSSLNAWPMASGDANTHYLLKMSWPLCRGDLWTALYPVMDRLIVVVGAEDLRREDAQINSRLSWEQCAEHTIHALQNNPIARELLRAAQLIVSFRSEGALWVTRGIAGQPSVYRLIFDPLRLEGDYDHDFEGTVYGFQTCLTAGIAHHLMAAEAAEVVTDQPQIHSPFKNTDAMAKALYQGIIAGLQARRTLLETGHGIISDSDKDQPGFPVKELGQIIASCPGGYVSVEVPPDSCQPWPILSNRNPLKDDSATGLPETSTHCQWTIITQSESSNTTPVTQQNALFGLAQLTARYGMGALSHVPSLQRGKLFTIDRNEIESYRTLDAIIRAYDEKKVQGKPLSIGVFGPPGAGKSFGVKALAKACLGDKVPFLEFNLSQFKSPEELIGAFHRVRDAVLGGTTPVAFWDEFDSQQYHWLQYLLAPMQDGSFQEGQITHPIGKCIFIFAGGTSPTMEEFGVAEPKPLTEEDIKKLEPSAHAERKQELSKQAEQLREFKLLKGPDFISRLHGYLNVLGPNARTGRECPDVTWPIRRAILLRGILGLKENERLDIDPGLLNALLCVPKYNHGARSFEKIIISLMDGQMNGRLHRSSLPPQSLLTCETDAEIFHDLLTQADAFKNHEDIEILAAAVHNSFLAGEEKSRIEAKQKAEPQRAWAIHPAIKKNYDQLKADNKAANRAAARRIPDHLALIGYAVERQQPNDDGSWKAELSAAIAKHLDRLALAEHLGWCAERISNGWKYAKERNDSFKLHPLLVDWTELSMAEQDKDRNSARSIIDLLEVAKFKAIPVLTPPEDIKGQSVAGK